MLGSLAGKVRRTAVLTHGTAHFELRQLDHLGTNVSILETDTPSRGVKNVLSDLSELLLGPLGHSLGHVLSESVSQ